ncbi:TPA: LapD/MoxY N-terminal periplasmic domain-containing protein [Legionella feeleii]
MTLTKKMALGVLSLLMLIFIGTYLITLNNERNYFIQQMNSNAQDTATSLGLSLSQALNSKDKALMLSMVEAVFDRGYFALIEVRDLNGELLVSRYSSPKQQKVPSWFIQLIKWPASVQSSIVMRGWNQVGEVFVASDCNYAFNALWHNAVELVYWYLLFALISLLIVYLFIQWLLKPLKGVRDQANAICEGEFPIETIIPKTPELKKVTLAMNQMVTRIKRLFQEQMQQLETLRHQSFQDPLTDLGNRRYFLQQTTALLSNEEEFTPGFLVILAIDGLEPLNKKQGYQAGDQIIQDVAKACVNFWPSAMIICMARISGSNFGLLVRENDPDLFIKRCNEFNLNVRKLFNNSVCNVFIAAASYSLHQSVSTLLTETDLVLKKAREEAKGIAFDVNTAIPYKINLDSKGIMAAISEGRISLFSQWVTSSRENYHQELFVRINEQGQQVFAGYFIPIAEKAGIAYLIDQFVLTKIIAADLLSHTKIALNLTQETVTNEDYRTDYIKKLETLSIESRSNLFIEFNEQFVLVHFEKVMSFVKLLQKLHIKVGVDQAGIHFSPMHYLSELAITYLKLHGSLTYDLAENQNKQFLLHYFNEMACTLDIQVIATQIETETQWQAINNIPLKWGQGCYLSDVEPFLTK